MKTNVGKTDMIIRYILAVVIFALGYYYRSWWGLIGLIPLLTAFFRVCPIYMPFKFSTDKSKK